MKYYFVKINDKLEIIKVQPNEEDQFQEEYAAVIKAEADSLGGLLGQLGKLQL